MAKKLALEIISKSLVGQRQTGNSEQKVNEIFYNMRNPDMTKKESDMTFNFTKAKEVDYRQQKDERMREK